jgi:hypothetical protein
LLEHEEKGQSWDEIWLLQHEEKGQSWDEISLLEHEEKGQSCWDPMQDSWLRVRRK